MAAQAEEVLSDADRSSSQLLLPDGDQFLLDVITWPSVTSGVSSQVKPANLNPTDNDNPANYCPATAPYGDLTNKGTPKAANAC